MQDSRREEMSQRKEPLKVFCSYADKDKDLCEQLHRHLRPLERQGQLTFWHDRLISAGTDRAEVIDAHLSAASLILLLISPDFMHADYCYGVEMQRALEKHRTNEACVIPILLRPVDWQDAPFAHLQPLPINGKPITKWENRDEAFLSIATGIRQVIKEVQSLSLSAPHTTLPSVWNIPSSRNFLFVGREDILARLYRNFHGASQRSQSLSGLGGIGKSQIAVEYAYRHSQEYRAVLWIGAESRESLVSGYVTAAGLLNLPEKDEKDQAVVVWAVRRWLETHREWLLILDNADDLSLAREFLPSRFEGHVLLTTRAQAMGRLADRLKIDPFEQETAALFLLRRAGLIDSVASLEEARSSDIAAAREICTELGGLPLALDQAGAYIEEMEYGLSRYLVSYRTRPEDLLRRRGKIVLDHPDPVTNTWLLSFEKVEQRNPVAADLLKLCAYFSPDDIPEELIMQGAVFPGLEALATDTSAFDEASAELRNYSLIQRDGDARTLSVHRLVQAVLRDVMDATMRRDWAQRATHVVNMVFPEVEFVSWSQCERYLSHALACVQWIEQEHLSSAEAAQVLLKVGWYLKDRVRYKEAEPLLNQALEMNSQHLPPDSVDIAQTLTIQAEMYHAWGYYAEAEPPYQKALTMYERLGSEHPYTISSMSNLASLYSSQGKFKEAKRLYQRVLTSREKDLGPEHLDTARSLSNLGCCYGDEGKYTEAESLLKRALTIYERQLSPDDPELADVLNNLAVLYCQQERYPQAEVFYQRALAIYKQQLGQDHPDTANGLNNLAGLYCQQGKYTRAKPLYQRALAICKQKLGPDHPDTANCMHNLATLYYEQQKYAKAESLLEQVLAICEQKLGPDHPDTAHCLRNLARLYDRQDRNAEAKPLYLRALEICEQQLGHDHPHTCSTREKYEDLLRKMETEESEKSEASEILPSQTS